MPPSGAGISDKPGLLKGKGVATTGSALVVPVRIVRHGLSYHRLVALGVPVQTYRDCSLGPWLCNGTKLAISLKRGPLPFKGFANNLAASIVIQSVQEFCLPLAMFQLVNVPFPGHCSVF